jgi:hypothetical protein
MSQKCQNLLPLKINRSQSKGIGFVAEKRKIEAYFPHTQIPSEASEEKTSTTQWTESRSDEGSFSCSKKVSNIMSNFYVVTVCRFFCSLKP